MAAWNANGQSVDFEIACPRADRYTLAFRHAAGAGDASRLVAVNGANSFPNQRFSSTGSWGVYGTNRLTCNLPAGASTVSVALNSSLGNVNYLNLSRGSAGPCQIFVTLRYSGRMTGSSPNLRVGGKNSFA